MITANTISAFTDNYFVINILTSITSFWPFPGNGPVKMLIEGYFLEIRPVISQLSGIDLMVLVLSLTTAVSLL